MYNLVYTHKEKIIPSDKALRDSDRIVFDSQYLKHYPNADKFAVDKNKSWAIELKSECQGRIIPTLAYHHSMIVYIEWCKEYRIGNSILDSQQIEELIDNGYILKL